MEGERKLFQGAYRLLLHLQDRLVGVIETKEAIERFAGRISGELGKPTCARVPEKLEAPWWPLGIFDRSWAQGHT